MNNLKSNAEPFQGIVIGGKVNNTKAIIMALLKADLNLPNIKPPNETTALIDIFDTSPNNKTNTRKV
jgi:hypothetical protein